MHFFRKRDRETTQDKFTCPSQNNLHISKCFGKSFNQSDQQILQCIEEVQSFINVETDFGSTKSLLQSKLQELHRLLSRNRDPTPVSLAIKSCQILMSILQKKTHQSIYASPPRLETPQNQQTIIKNPKMREYQQNKILFENIFQLSQICEHIPELEAFRKRISISVRKNNSSHHLNPDSILLKIVDVFIQLHHQVEQLLTEKPLQLASRIQSVHFQCTILQQSIYEVTKDIRNFLRGNTKQIKSIIFNQKINKSPQCFRKVQKGISEMSEQICILLKPEISPTLEQEILELLEIYLQFMVKSCELTEHHESSQIHEELRRQLESLEGEWSELRIRSKTRVGQRIRQILEECFEIFYQKIQKLSSLTKKGQQRQQLISKIEKEIKKIQSNQSSRSKAVSKEYDQEFEELKEQFEYALAQNSRLEETVSYYKQKIEQLQKRNKFNEKIITSLNQKSKSQKNQNAILSAQVISLKFEFDQEKKNQLEDLYRKNSELQQIIDMMGSEKLNEDSLRFSYEANNTQEKVMNEIEILQKENTELRQKLQRNQEEDQKLKLKQFQERNQQLQCENRNKSLKIDQLNFIVTDLNLQLKDFLMRIRQYEKNLQRNEKNILNLQTNINLLKEEKRTLQNQLMKTGIQLKNTLQELETSHLLFDQIKKESEEREKKRFN